MQGDKIADFMFGITPDLTCLGKVIGGGLPVGAYAGKQVELSISYASDWSVQGLGAFVDRGASRFIVTDLEELL